MTGGPPSHGSGETSALVPTLVQKELRALAPVFLATGGLMLLCATGAQPGLLTLGLGAYVLGVSALGALSIGHEFSCDTIGQLLTQPGHRSRLLMIKLMVLAALLTLLATATAIALWPSASRLGYGEAYTEPLRSPIVLIPALLAAFVAPLLTMLSRSAIAGTVFTVGIYAGLWLIAPGFTSPAFTEETVDIGFYAGTMLCIAVGVSALSAVAGAVMFNRLEFTGSHSAMAWTASRSSDASRAQALPASGHPAGALLRKELRLQTVSFVIAGLYVTLWALYALTGSHSTEVMYAFEGGTLLYQFILAMLIGAPASAEERGLGTLHWQMLQPYAAWKQWTIKAATALTLTSVLVVALPALSAIDADIVDRFWLGLRIDGGSLAFLIDNWRLWIYVTTLIALTVTGLFASTFNRSSLHALLTTGVLAVIGALAFRAAFAAGSYAVWIGLDLNKFYNDYALRGPVDANFSTWGMDDYVLAKVITLGVITVAVVGFLLLLLKLGLTNHRAAETPRAVLMRQVLTLLAFGAIASLLVGGGQPLLHYYLFTH